MSGLVEGDGHRPAVPILGHLADELAPERHAKAVLRLDVAVEEGGRGSLFRGLSVSGRDAEDRVLSFENRLVLPTLPQPWEHILDSVPGGVEEVLVERRVCANLKRPDVADQPRPLLRRCGHGQDQHEGAPVPVDGAEVVEEERVDVVPELDFRQDPLPGIQIENEEVRGRTQPRVGERSVEFNVNRPKLTDTSFDPCRNHLVSRVDEEHLDDGRNQMSLQGLVEMHGGPPRGDSIPVSCGGKRILGGSGVTGWNQSRSRPHSKARDQEGPLQASVDT